MIGTCRGTTRSSLVAKFSFPLLSGTIPASLLLSGVRDLGDPTCECGVLSHAGVQHFRSPGRPLPALAE